MFQKNYINHHHHDGLQGSAVMSYDLVLSKILKPLNSDPQVGHNNFYSFNC